jgi:hypothetical protein
MEENVNKAASWEDVLLDNYNQPAQTEQEAQEEQQQEGAVSENTVDANGDPVQQETTDAPQTEEQPVVQQDEPVVQQEIVQDDVQQPQEEPQLNLNNLDEDALYEYLSIKKTDYNQVPDLDILAGKIKSENPNWDNEDIELELESKYGAALFSEKIDLDTIDQDLDPETYKEAIKINKEIERAEKLLRRDAKETRAQLEEIKNNLSLPTSEGGKPEHSVEASGKQETESDELTPEQIQYLQQQWLTAVEKEVPSVNEFKFNLGDEEVSYKVTADEQQQLVQKMKEFNAESYLVQRGWVKPDGTPDVKKITEDVYILENAEKMFKSGWTQAKEKAKMDIIGKDIKNINLDSSQSTFDAKASNPYDFGDYVLSL